MFWIVGLMDEGRMRKVVSGRGGWMIGVFLWCRLLGGG